MARMKSRAAADDGNGMLFLKDLVTIVSIVHLLAACAYILGYCYGFGHHIIAFVALSDIFISSLRAVAQVYIFMCVPVVLFLLHGAIRRKLPAVGAYGILAAMTVLAIGLILATQVSFGRQWHILELATVGGILVILIGCLVWLVRRDRSLLVFGHLDLVLAVAILLSVSLVLGLNKGITDEGRNYWKSVDGYFMCRDGRLIIRPVGANYLSLDQAQRWAVVDPSCRPLFFLHG